MKKQIVNERREVKKEKNEKGVKMDEGEAPDVSGAKFS